MSVQRVPPEDNDCPARRLSTTPPSPSSSSSPKLTGRCVLVTPLLPLPSEALKDTKKYGENPVGNGPYKIEEKGLEHNVQIQLVKNADYTGPA